MAKMHTVLMPQYMSGFSCIGSACEDSCCAGWRVDIDKSTYKKYNRVRHPQLTSLLNKNIVRNRSNPTDASYAKIKLDKTGSCVFLNEEKLCNIQLSLGEEYLSQVCTTYPRSNNLVNEVMEKAATTSCPEVARLALLNPDGIQFEQFDEWKNSSIRIRKSLNTKNNAEDTVSNYFWELRIFTISLLQNRNYSLQDRLILLGMFFKKLDSYVLDKKYQDIPQLIATYSSAIEDRSLLDSLEQIPARQDIQLNLVRKVSDAKFIMGITNQRYLDCYRKMLNALTTDKDSINESNVEIYVDAYNNYYKPFMDENEYILENYMVNYVFSNLFPFTGFSTVFDNYVMLITHFAMVKLNLIGVAGYDKKLDIEQVIIVIQSFSKVVEHNNLFLRSIFEFLKENNCTNMAYMAVLIKN